MSYICCDCLEAQSPHSFFRAMPFGPCEDCGTVTECADA